MAVDFENSQTKKNLEAAFAGESQASRKYAYYASQAKKDGYEQIKGGIERVVPAERGDAEVEGAAPYLAGDAGGDEQDDRDPHGTQAAPGQKPCCRRRRVVACRA